MSRDPVTAYAVGQVPSTYTQALATDGLKGTRIGVIREPLDPRADPASADYKQVRAVIDRALADLARLGAAVVDPVRIPDVVSRSIRVSLRPPGGLSTLCS
ncbi:MAG: hypothetical protein HY047_10650 [Acidobacteria bacterium]|nr:hypothetical protein [Acidobacteriota bacterium]